MRKRKRRENKNKEKDLRSPFDRTMEKYIKKYRRIEEKERKRIQRKFERYMR